MRDGIAALVSRVEFILKTPDYTSNSTELLRFLILRTEHVEGIEGGQGRYM